MPAHVAHCMPKHQSPAPRSANRRPPSPRGERGEGGLGRSGAWPAGELLDAVQASVKIARLLIRILGRLAQRARRLEGAMFSISSASLSKSVPDTGGVDPDTRRAGWARRSSRRNHAQRLILGLVLLAGEYPRPPIVTFSELGLSTERCDRRIQGRGLDARGQVDVLISAALRDQRGLDLGGPPCAVRTTISLRFRTMS